MGEIQCNTGYGRVFEQGSGWRIQAWVGQGSPCQHKCFDLGSATSAADRQTYADRCALAYNGGNPGGAPAWLAAHPPAFATWLASLTAVEQGLVFECARFAGANGLPP